MWEEIGPF